MRLQTAGRTLAAAQAPVVAMLAVTEITGVCLGEKDIDQSAAANLVRQRVGPASPRPSSFEPGGDPFNGFVHVFMRSGVA